MHLDMAVTGAAFLFPSLGLPEPKYSRGYAPVTSRFWTRTTRVVEF